MLRETRQLALPAPSPAGSLQVVNFGEETKLAGCRSPALPKDREVRAQHQEPDLERANLEAAWVTPQLEFSTLLIANGTPKKQRVSKRRVITAREPRALLVLRLVVSVPPERLLAAVAPRGDGARGQGAQHLGRSRATRGARITACPEGQHPGAPPGHLHSELAHTQSQEFVTRARSLPPPSPLPPLPGVLPQ